MWLIVDASNTSLSVEKLGCKGFIIYVSIIIIVIVSIIVTRFTSTSLVIKSSDVVHNVFLRTVVNKSVSFNIWFILGKNKLNCKIRGMLENSFYQNYIFFIVIFIQMKTNFHNGIISHSSFASTATAACWENLRSFSGLPSGLILIPK